MFVPEHISRNAITRGHDVLVVKSTFDFDKRCSTRVSVGVKGISGIRIGLIVSVHLIIT